MKKTLFAALLMCATGCTSTRVESSSPLHPDSRQSDSFLRINDHCTGVYISPDGLVLTSFDCVRDALARLDVLDNGFMASDRGKEVPVDGLQVTTPKGRRLNDVRLAYSPEAGVADFGGTREMWNWPRSAANFALLRIKREEAGAFSTLSADELSDGDALTLQGFFCGDFNVSSASAKSAAAGVEYGDKFLHAISSSARGRRNVLLLNADRYHEISRQVAQIRRIADGASSSEPADRRDALLFWLLKTSDLVANNYSDKSDSTGKRSFDGTEFAALQLFFREALALPDGFRIAAVDEAIVRTREKEQAAQIYKAVGEIVISDGKSNEPLKRFAASLRHQFNDNKPVLNSLLGCYDRSHTPMLRAVSGHVRPPSDMSSPVSTSRRFAALASTLDPYVISEDVVAHASRNEAPVNFTVEPISPVLKFSGAACIDPAGRVCGIAFDGDSDAARATLGARNGRIVFVTPSIIRSLLQINSAFTLLAEINNTSTHYAEARSSTEVP